MHLLGSQNRKEYGKGSKRKCSDINVFIDLILLTEND